MRRRILALGTTLALIGVLLDATRAFAQSETPTDKIVACVDAAAEDFVECVEMNAWYWTWPCTWRYEADVILCLPTSILGIAKK